MEDTLFKNALQNALENITGRNLPKADYATTVEMLNDFNSSYVSVVTFSVKSGETTISDPTIVVKKGTKTISPESNGTYKLKEGTYTYSVSKTGYESIENANLSISQSDVTTGTKTVNVSMTEEDGE